MMKSGAINPAVRPKMEDILVNIAWKRSSSFPLDLIQIILAFIPFQVSKSLPETLRDYQQHTT